VIYKACSLLLEVFCSKAYKTYSFFNLDNLEQAWIKGIFNEKLSNPQSTIFLGHHHFWQLRLSDREFNQWQRQQGSIILFFDGALSGNLREVGVGGVAFDSAGNKNIEYFLGAR
jgi:hypothetical protein